MSKEPNVATATAVLSIIVTLAIGYVNHIDAAAADQKAEEANANSATANQISYQALGESKVANATAEAGLQLAQRIDSEHQPIITASCTQSIGPAPEATGTEVIGLGLHLNPVGSDQHPILIRNPKASWLRCEVENVGNIAARDVSLTFHFIHQSTASAVYNQRYTDDNSNRATALFEVLAPNATASVFYLANIDNKYKAEVEPPSTITYSPGATDVRTTEPIRLDWGRAELDPLRK